MLEQMYCYLPLLEILSVVHHLNAGFTAVEICLIADKYFGCFFCDYFYQLFTSALLFSQLAEIFACFICWHKLFLPQRRMNE